ncbi:MAG TPA: hypothetical protein VN154_03655 [Rhizomicrobium sp.]|nr:hypothetical protein [Rhizomicrobium sp.]
MTGGTILKLERRFAGNKRLGPAGWLAIVSLAGFLVGAIVYAIHTWSSLEGVSMPLAGWVFMSLGVIVTFAVGAGLMALVFYSSREGKDF